MDRIVELEKSSAFHEQQLEDLKEIVSGQQRRIKKLEERVELLTAKVSDESVVIDLEDEEPPPHY